LAFFHHDRKKGPGGDPEDAVDLGIGQAEERRRALDEKGLVRVVTPEVLGDETDDGIVDDVERKDLTVVAFSFQDKIEDDEVEEVEDRLVKLDRMEGHVKRNTGRVMGVSVLENRPPGEPPINPDPGASLIRAGADR